MEVDGKTYHFVIASDVERDGMGLECSVDGAPEQVLLEAFWHDASGCFTFKASQGQFPFELVEKFVRIARRRLPPARGRR